IKLSAEAQVALGTEAKSATPAELMRIILQAPVDLLWNGGIGTYVKASLWMSRPTSRKCRDTLSQAPRAVMPIFLWS
ncbi:MAG TPA: NAD-glutamate dehydrogenase domain-containing protein, partial [Nevskiaceae bacterium]|nr:NAD-glutamate dehydrogenase domain-containing protein [Nevskiaceae bacterium]